MLGRFSCRITCLICLAAMAGLVLPVRAQGPAKGEKTPGSPPPAGPPPALVRVGAVASELVQNQWNVVGRLAQVRRAVVAAEQSGRVVAVQAEEGDAVTGNKTVLAKIDDVWAKLDLRTTEAKVQQTEARVAETDARLDQSRRDLRALEDLLASNSAKPREVEDQRATVAEDKAQLDYAHAQLAAAQVEHDRSKENLARLTIVAPFDGVVVKKLTEVGEWVNKGSGVAEIISTGTIDAVIDVPEKYVNYLRPGQNLEVVIESLSVEVTGRVASITPLGSTAARTFPVKVRIDDRQGKLKSGMSVVARVPTGRKSRQLTVPRDAVQRSAVGNAVWLNLDGKAMPVSVKVLFGVGDRYAVAPVGGGPPLMPGMQVVIEGAERLFPTQPLIVQNRPPADAPAP